MLCFVDFQLNKSKQTVYFVVLIFIENLYFVKFRKCIFTQEFERKIIKNFMN